MTLFQAFFDRQDQRDAKREKETKEWKEEQERRDAKREKETKEWKEEQERRDAKRDNEAKEWREEQARREEKRDNEAKEWKEEQAKRDKAIINALTQLTRNPEHQISRGKQLVSNTADPHTPLPRYSNSIDQLTPRLPNIQSQTKSSVAALSKLDS
ncbi:hypothetical protein H4S06_004238 [Coemansia sp. BCRC 34490]|nr:hypothetical protein H4S06_004238 [Coemansia sp. BCRC 34490]